MSGSGDTTIRVWDVTTGQQKREALHSHNDNVHSLAFSSNGIQIMSESNDKTITVWDQLLLPFTVKQDWITTSSDLPVIWISYTFQNYYLIISSQHLIISQRPYIVFTSLLSSFQSSL